MKHVIPKETKPKTGKRYEVCVRCRRWWNVSAKLVLPYDGYVCPQCSGRRKI